jgi:uncharacterized protein (DUF697 family)
MSDAESQTPEEREQQARGIVDRYVKWSFGAGLLPIPLLDVATITGVQLRMLSQLAKHYGVEFRENAAKSVVSALLGGLLPTNLAYGGIGSLVKSIPLVGQLAGIVVLPTFASAATYAVGRVFIQHFESGGTFLDFDPASVREHFQQEFEKAGGNKKRAA